MSLIRNKPIGSPARTNVIAVDYSLDPSGRDIPPTDQSMIEVAYSRFGIGRVVYTAIE